MPAATTPEPAIPVAVWALESGSMGLIGVFNNEAAAKGEASRLARTTLDWQPFFGNEVFAVTDPADPDSEAYFVAMRGVLSRAGQRDPLNDGTAAATEPVEDPELAADIFRVLAHEMHHGGIGKAEDCPACEASPNPFTV